MNSNFYFKESSPVRGFDGLSENFNAKSCHEDYLVSICLN